MRRASVLLVIITVLLSGCYRGSRPPRIGTAAPNFTVQDADSKVTLSDFHGKVVLLNFWASWCAPCVEEMPSLVQLQQRFKVKISFANDKVKNCRFTGSALKEEKLDQILKVICNFNNATYQTKADGSIVIDGPGCD